jgi:hypothetical protein
MQRLPRLFGLAPGHVAALLTGWCAFGLVSLTFPHLALWGLNIVLLQLLTAVLVVSYRKDG